MKMLQRIHSLFPVFLVLRDLTFSLLDCAILLSVLSSRQICLQFCDLQGIHKSSARDIPPSLYLWHFEEFVSLLLSSLIKTDSFDSSNVRLRRRQD